MKNKLIIVTLILALVLVGCSGSQDPASTSEGTNKEIDFVLDWTPNTNHIGVYVAKEKGYYDEVGIGVNIIQPPEDGPELLIGAGSGDIGVSFQDSLAAIYGSGQDVPITAVAAILQHNTSGIISRLEDDITRPKDMEGQSYASGNWQMGTAIVEEVVRQDGGDWDKVEVLPVTATDEVSSLQSGLADTIWVYYGWGGIATQLAGLDTNYFAFRDIDETFDYYTPVLIARDSLLEEDPGLVEDFLDATRRGYEYAIENPEDAAQILVDADTSLDIQMVEESITYLSDYYVDADVPWGHMDQARWDNFFAWAYDRGLIEEEIGPGFGMTNDYLGQ